MVIVMPRQSRTVKLNTCQDQLHISLLNVASELGLRTKHRFSGQFIFTENLNLFGYTNPATIEVSYSAKAPVSSAHVVVHNFGWGPIQNNHCKKILDQFCQSLLSFESGGIHTSHLRR